jgi:hypothetical protein
VRRRAAAEMIVHCSNHTFRATGITVYLNASGTLENAQRMKHFASVNSIPFRHDESIILPKPDILIR